MPPAPVLRSSLTPGGVAEAGEGVPLREYVSALRRHAWLIIASAVVAVAFAAYRIHQELPRYTAASSIRLVNARQELAGDMGSGLNDGLPGYYMDPILSYIQILKSRAVAGAVVDSLGLRLQPDDPEFPYAAVERVRVADDARTGDELLLTFSEGGVRGRMAGEEASAAFGEPLALAGVEIVFVRAPGTDETVRMRVVDRDAAVFQVVGGLDPRPMEMTNVIHLYFTAHDPYLAQRVANAAAAAFQAASARSAQQQSRRRRLFIQDQLTSTDSLLANAQRELSGFRKGVQAFSPREKFRTTQEGLTSLRLQREAVAAEKRTYDQMRRELELDRGREGAEQIAALAASPEVASNGGIVSLYSQLIRYQTARDSLTTGRWSRAGTNPDVEQLDSLISTFKARMVRAVGARSEALAGQLAVLDEVMRSDVEEIRELPDAEAEEMRLSRQVETLQKLADDLLRERQRARIDEAVETGQVDVIDWALVPGAPISPGSRRRLAFALLVGLMIGGSGALVLDRLNTTLTRRDDVETLLHVPALGVIPRIGATGNERARLLPRARSRVGTVRPADALVTVSDLHSPGSQAYRKLRTHLLFSHRGSSPRLLLVTSPGASEGKSTVSSNLGVSFAQQNLRVLLVDADLRRSRLHSIFDTRRVPGLTEVLQAEAPLDEAVQSTDVPGLDLLVAGRMVPNVSELLGSDPMRRLLAELGTRYDLVIVDTPPVLAAADAEIMGVQADAVLMVVRAGQTERQSAQYAVQQLRAIGARVIGAVLNDPDGKVPDSSRYTYYYDYTETAAG